MAVIIRVPGSLKSWFNDNDEVTCISGTLAECFEQVEQQYPGFHKRVLKDNELKDTAVFLNGDNIQYRDGLDTPVHDDDEIALIPLVAGG